MSVILFIISGILFLLSVILLTGHGAFLISGYNTASPEEKACYDEEKLCRVTGAGLLPMAVILLLNGLIPELPVWLLLAVILVSAVITVVGGNVWCKDREAARKLKRSGRWRSPRQKTTLILSLLLTAAILVFVVVMLFIGSVTVNLGNDSLTLGATLTKSSTVDYSQIQEISLEKELDFGTRTNGIGNSVIHAGHFKNDRFGAYYLYAYNSTHSYIIIQTEETVYVCNEKTEEATDTLYQQLSEKVS